MALPGAQQGGEGKWRVGLPGSVPPSGSVAAGTDKALRGGAGDFRAALSSQPVRAAASLPMLVPFSRNSSATRRGLWRAGGSRRWRWWGSRSTKPRRKGCSSYSSTSEEPTTRVRDAPCPVGLGRCLWLTAASRGLVKAGCLEAMTLLAHLACGSWHWGFVMGMAPHWEE